ncbi:MAG TPA: class I SAM-dependent methyltransferase [Candidatus Dormibacteraeota bacterium]|jgi:SAM-dependent methyltransferase|nr:class I SAM-dependent methyltransferase [Candidatus Dormibacteraeota bacterium]
MLARLISVIKGDPHRDPWKRLQYEVLADILQPLLQGADVVADFGCGEGLLTTLLAERARSTRFIGIDSVAEAAWDRSPAVQFRVGDAASLPLGAGAADVVVAKDLLHHMDDPREGVRSLVATARRRLVILEANLDNPIMALYTRHNGDAHFPRSVLESMLRESAPEQVSWQFGAVTAYPFYLPPAGGAAALWVWPVTAVMIVAFKLLRSRRLATALHRAMVRLPWQPPFTLAVAEVVPHGGGVQAPAPAGATRAAV